MQNPAGGARRQRSTPRLKDSVLSSMHAVASAVSASAESRQHPSSPPYRSLFFVVLIAVFYNSYSTWTICALSSSLKFASSAAPSRGVAPATAGYRARPPIFDVSAAMHNPERPPFLREFQRHAGAVQHVTIGRVKRFGLAVATATRCPRHDGTFIAPRRFPADRGSSTNGLRPA